jgi:hypothetical protein
MSLLFQDGGQLGRQRNLSMLERTPQEFRRRAADCRELAETCLTEEAHQILNDLAADLDCKAKKLEESSDKPVLGGGRF